MNGEAGLLTVPLCDPCGERAEMMLSVAILVGKVLPLETVANELCALCSNVLMHAVEEN